MRRSVPFDGPPRLLDIEGRAVCQEAPLKTSEVIARSQLEGWRQALNVEDGLLKVLGPHWLQNAIHSGQGFDNAAVMYARKLEPRLTAKGRACQRSAFLARPVWKKQVGAYRKPMVKRCSWEATEALKRVKVTVPYEEHLTSSSPGFVMCSAFRTSMK